MTPSIYIEAVARAMCKADGRDPEKYSDFMPNWAHYEAEAQRFCAAYEVMERPMAFVPGVSAPEQAKK